MKIKLDHGGKIEKEKQLFFLSDQGMTLQCHFTRHIVSKNEEILRGCSYGGELARLGGLAHLGEMIFIPRSYGIFCVSSVKKFVRSLKKECLIK